MHDVSGVKANLEGDVLVRRPSVEAQDGEAGVIRLLEVVLRGLLAVDQVRVEHVELVALEERKTKEKKTPEKRGTKNKNTSQNKGDENKTRHKKETRPG